MACGLFVIDFSLRFTLINLIKEVLTGIEMMSHRKLLPPTNIRRTLSNRKATPLSLTGEVSMQQVIVLLFTYNPVVQHKFSRYYNEHFDQCMPSETNSMGEFLAELGLGQNDVGTKFAEEHITLDILLEMDTGELKETLKELRIRTGHRFKLMRAIKKMKNKKEQQG